MTQKDTALAYYDGALRDANNPELDWRVVADKLAGALRGKRSKAAANDNSWGDYLITNYRKIEWPSPVVAAEFEGGEKVRMSFSTLAGKSLNVGRALRIAVAAYQARMASRARASASEIVQSLEQKADADIAYDEWIKLAVSAEKAKVDLEEYEKTEPSSVERSADPDAAWRWSDTRAGLHYKASDSERARDDAKSKLERITSEIRAAYERKVLEATVVPDFTNVTIERGGEVVETLDPVECNKRTVADRNQSASNERMAA